MFKREIHIWDLPQNKIYIQLRKEFREDFFNDAYFQFGSWRKLGDFLGVKRGDTLIAINWKKGNNCFPLKVGLQIARFLKIDLTEFEKNIIIIKSYTIIIYM